MSSRSFQQTLDVVVGPYLFASDRKDAVAGVDVAYRLSERRLLVRIPASADQNPRQAVVAVFDCVISAEQPARNFLSLRDLSSSAAQMADRETAEHLLEDVVEVAARRDRLHVRLKPLLFFNGIHAVEVGIIEVSALDSPHLVVHLIPLRCWIDAYLEIGKRHRPFAWLHRRIRGDDD